MAARNRAVEERQGIPRRDMLGRAGLGLVGMLAGPAVGQGAAGPADWLLTTLRLEGLGRRLHAITAATGDPFAADQARQMAADKTVAMVRLRGLLPGHAPVSPPSRAAAPVLGRHPLNALLHLETILVARYRAAAPGLPVSVVAANLSLAIFHIANVRVLLDRGE